MIKRAIVLAATLLAPLIASGAPDPAFEPAAFLAGHCWKGAMPDGKGTDEHCFSWIYEGKFMRDRHTVRVGDKVAYEGETIYYWNPAAKHIEYLYITAQGGYSHGRVKHEGELLVFPAAKLVTQGQIFGFRGVWRRLNDDAYEVLREYETDKGWMPVRLEMRRVK